MKAKIGSDIVLNIAASIMPIFVLQFVFLPLVASEISASSYGQLLTLIGLMSLSASTLGSVLNNIRLLTFKTYEQSSEKGDFNLLVILFNFINICIMTIFIFVFMEDGLTYKIVFLAASILLLLIDYGRVEFRINLNYMRVFYESSFIVAGYGVGYLLFKYTGHWQYIFLIGYLSSFLYIISKTKLFKEPFIKTNMFKSTSSQAVILLVSGLLIATATYVDRLLLYPTLGSEAVAIYYIATLLGKSVFLVIQPVAGVLLSYLARLQRMENKYFYLLLFLSALVGAVGYFVIIAISEPFLAHLYPDYYEEALKYIKVTTLASVITLICNVINPMIIKFCNLKWQLVINATYLVNFLLFSFLFMQFYGLIGLCIGVVIASAVNLIGMIGVYYFFGMNAKHPAVSSS
jgi:hypothetical protein